MTLTPAKLDERANRHTGEEAQALGSAAMKCIASIVMATSRSWMAQITALLHTSIAPVARSVALLLPPEDSDMGRALVIDRALDEGRDIAMDPEARAALEALALSMSPTFERESRWVWRELRARERQEGKSRATVRLEVLTNALIEAFLSSRKATTHKISRKGFRGDEQHSGYLVDDHGKHIAIPPIDLPFDLYLWWLRKEVLVIARESLAPRSRRRKESAPTQARANVSEEQILLARSAEIQTLQALLAAQESDELLAMLRAAGKCTERQSSIWLMHHDLKLTSTEIARHMGCTPGAVRSTVFDVRRKLREYYSPSQRSA